MIKPHTLLAAIALTALGALDARTATAGGCEDAVVAECVKTTCPTFCATLAAGEVAACKASCATSDRCRLTLFGGQDRADQVELDVQKREHLMACLAENRAPVKVPADRGKPILKDTDYVAPTDDSVQAIPHGSIRDEKARRTGWRKVKARSFAERRKGSRRRDPTRPGTPAPPPARPR